MTDTEQNTPVQSIETKVTVCNWQGVPLDAEAHVTIGDHSLVREDETATYAGRLPAGEYDLQVSDGKLVSPSRTVLVGASPKHIVAYIGEPGWPFYRLGENAIPFPPPGPLLAVAFPDRSPDPKEAQELRGRLAEELPLDPVQSYGAQQDYDGDTPTDDAIWVFKITRKDSSRLRAELHRKILEIVGERGRVGVPVDQEPGRAAVIDNRFVLRFQDELEEYEIERLLAEVKATTRRRLSVLRHARLVDFQPADYNKHLEQVEKLHAAGVLVYGEPDIMAEFADDAFPEDPPNDPTFGSQANLTLQNVDLAWQMLDASDPLRTLGSADVVVASLDRGLDTDHPDIGGTLTDGSGQVLRCYDFSGLRECTVPGYTPDTSHGMGVYGIIAALTNNGDDIAGIASNTRQIVMERPNLTSVNYSDVLLWAAGFDTGNPSPGWPAEPLADGADIISCSHGRDGLALSGVMDDTFQTLANSGRGGLGTIVIYSAGNANTLITGFRTWAAHPDTIAVANSNLPNASGVESKVGSSNFGPEIDLCAQGDGAPSLNASGGEQSFGGTSAAAPTVAAAAALILSANPVLRREEVRDILRDTAVKIDPNNGNTTGRWRDINGLISTNPGYLGPNFSQFYGFGRLNVSAAVEEAGWRLTLIIADQGDFGNVCANGFRDLMLTLVNSGVNTIPISDILSSSPHFVVPNVLNFPFAIDPGTAVGVPIRFQPGSLGATSATITVQAGPFTARAIGVSGDSRPPQLDLIIVNGGEFGRACVGEGVDKPLSILNSGPCPLMVTNISSSSGDFRIAEVRSFPLTIAPGTAVEIPVRFAPTSFGSKSGTITVTSNDPSGPKSVSVSGLAPSGKLTVTGSTCIGGVAEGCMGERMIAICNTGDCPLSVSSVDLKRPSKVWSLVNNPFPARLHPGACLNVLIRYLADEKCPRAAELVIQSDDPEMPEKVMDLMAYTSPKPKKFACIGSCDCDCKTERDCGCDIQCLDACCSDEGASA